MLSPGGSESFRLSCEKVAYWYLRLNGFLQIENFYVHPAGRGGARTDADLLAVRFPYPKLDSETGPHVSGALISLSFSPPAQAWR
jgi:hypothetical protein